MFDLARELEQIALEDDYFVEKKLYPNVDFYSGIIYRALGIPTSMFTVMFAIGRSVGWTAHWREMISDPTRTHQPDQASALHRCGATRLRSNREAVSLVTNPWIFLRPGRCVRYCRSINMLFAGTRFFGLDAPFHRFAVDR